MSDQSEIEYIRSRIEWINEHEKMFQLSYCMKLEREALKERLSEIEGEVTTHD